MYLSRCGVEEHGRFTTRRERMNGACNGRVYIHESNGGMDCPQREAAEDRADIEAKEYDR